MAQVLAQLASVTPIRNGHRITGGALGGNATEQSGAGQVGRTTIEILSSRERVTIISSSELAIHLVHGKWKVSILAQMIDRPIRLGQLRRLIPRVSKKVLVQQLHELEEDGIIVRADLSGKVKHVEYTISTPFGMAVMQLLRLLSDWGIRYAPTMALRGRTQIGPTPVLTLPAKSEITVRTE